MIIRSLIFLFVVVPSLWGALMVICELHEWNEDKAAAKQLVPQLGRSIYLGVPLWRRVESEFSRGYWSAFAHISALIIFGIIFWLISRG